MTTTPTMYLSPRKRAAIEGESGVIRRKTHLPPEIQNPAHTAEARITVAQRILPFKAALGGAPIEYRGYPDFRP